MGAKKQEGEGEMKDFQAGDRVTGVEGAVVIFRGEAIYRFKDDDGRWRWHCVGENGMVYKWIEGSLLHGHNVTVEIKGEELPERLSGGDEVVECVIHDFSIHHIRSKKAYVAVKMPEHLAREYQSWRDKEK